MNVTFRVTDDPLTVSEPVQAFVPSTQASYLGNCPNFQEVRPVPQPQGDLGARRARVRGHPVASRALLLRRRAQRTDMPHRAAAEARLVEGNREQSGREPNMKQNILGRKIGGTVSARRHPALLHAERVARDRGDRERVSGRCETMERDGPLRRTELALDRDAPDRPGDEARLGERHRVGRILAGGPAGAGAVPEPPNAAADAMEKPAVVATRTITATRDSAREVRMAVILRSTLMRIDAHHLERCRVLLERFVGGTRRRATGVCDRRRGQPAWYGTRPPGRTASAVRVVQVESKLVESATQVEVSLPKIADRIMRRRGGESTPFPKVTREGRPSHRPRNRRPAPSPNIPRCPGHPRSRTARPRRADVTRTGTVRREMEQPGGSVPQDPRHVKPEGRVRPNPCTVGYSIAECWIHTFRIATIASVASGVGTARVRSEERLRGS